MAPQSFRQRFAASFARRRPSVQFAHLHCEPFEDRIAPALFTVGSPLSFTGLNNDGFVAVADFNKDGIQDAVLTNFGTWSPQLGGTPGNTITVLYGKQSGGFSPVTLNCGGSMPSYAAVGDLNGDGFPDVVVCNQNQQNDGSFAVFLNDGKGNLSLSKTYSTSSNNPSWIGLADVTGGGHLDVVVASYGKDDGTGNNITGNNMTIFQGNGDGTFSSTPTTTLSPSIQFIPTACAIADFNGDGIMDIAAAVPGVPQDSNSPQPNGSIYLFQGTGSGGFSAPNQFDTGGALPVNLQAADVDGDGKPDLIVANAGDPNATPEFSNDSVGVLLDASSSGTVNFGPTNSLTANCHGTFAVAVADFNGDGKQDIAAINYGAYLLSAPNAFVSVYMGTGGGSFSPGSPATYDLKVNSPGGQSLAVGDFDGNGTPDLIAVGTYNKVTLLSNSSSAPVSTTTTLASSLNPSAVGQSVVFTATVTASSGTATGGTVKFFDNGTQVGNPVNLGANGQAALTTSSLPAGNDSITATYSGAAGFAGSTTATPLTQVVNAASAASLSFSTVPANAMAGAPFSFTLKALDQSGNVAAGYRGTVHFTTTDTGTGLSLPADYTFVSADNGVHTFTNLTKLVTAAGQTLTATDTANSSLTGTSSSITVSPAAADHLVFGQQPTDATAGAAISPAVTVKLLDVYGNLTTSTATVTLSAAGNPSVAASGGVATFSNLVLTTAGSYTLSASSSGLTGATSDAFQISPAAASQLAFGVQPSNTKVNVAISPAVTVKVLDAYGNPTSSTATLNLSASGPGSFTSGSTTSVAAVAGVATFSNLALTTSGSYSLGAFSNSGLTTATSNNFQVSPAATHFTISASTSSTTAGSPFTFTITALDQNNNTDTGYNGVVHFTSSDPQASLPADTPLTGGTGYLFATLKTAGAQLLAATDSANSITGTSGLIAVSAASADHLLFTQLPTNTTAGVAINPAVTLKVVDQYGNPTSGTATVSLSASGPGAFTAGSTTSVTASGGVASFPNLVLTVAGSYTLGASSSGLTAAVSPSFNVTAAAADHLKFVQQPTAASADAAISPAVTVQVLDQYNNPTTSTATVSLSASGPGGFTSDSTTSVAASGGVATFATLALSNVGNYTLSASSTGLTGATSDAFQVTPAVTRFAISAPASAMAGTPVPYTVTALDQFNNPVTDYNGPVHFTCSDGQAVLPTDSTLVGGRGSFIATLKTAGDATITASNPTGISGASAPMAITPANPVKLAFGLQPANTFVNNRTLPKFNVVVEDRFNNVVTTDNSDVVKISLGHNPSKAKLTGTTSVKVVNGVATFSHLHLSNAGVGFTLTVTDSPLKKAVSRPFNVAGANHFKVTVAPASVAAGKFVLVTVQALDAKNHVVPSYTGQIDFASNDPHAVLPKDSKLVHGKGTFRVQLETAGQDTITVTDVAHTRIKGMAAVHVSSAAPKARKRADLHQATPGASGTPASQAVDANLAALLELMEEWRKAGMSPGWLSTAG